MRLVILESPFAAPTPEGVAANVDYARRCVRDSLHLAQACGEKSRGPFSTWIHSQKRAGKLIAVGTEVGPSGALNTIWGLP